jgi:hypothetical protein
MNTLNFNDADLKANREGRLSDAQAKRVEAQAAQFRKVVRWIIVLMVLVIVGGSMMMISMSHAAYEGRMNQSLISALTLYIGVGLIFIVMLGLFYVLSLYSITHARVKAVEGRADVLSTYTTVWMNKIPQRLPVNRLQLHRSRNRMSAFHFSDIVSLRYFENGKHYRVYYLSQLTPFALSAEEIEPEKAKR